MPTSYEQMLALAIDAVVGGGVATVAIAATFAVAFSSIRRIDTFGDVRPEHVVEPQPT
jgi:hypothetical protein